MKKGCLNWSVEQLPNMTNTSCTECHEPVRLGNIILYTVNAGGSGGFEVIVCANCGNIFTYWDQELNLQEFYDSMDYTVRDTKKSIFFLVQEFEYRRVLSTMSRLAVTKPKTLLDFGAGKGVFLHIAKLAGFEVKGVETSIPRANYAKEHYQLTIDTNEFSSGKIFGQEFDAITSIHVFEHIPSARSLMKSLIVDNLTDNGICVFEVPNFQSWQSKWSKGSWMHLDVPRHINHFTPRRFESYLEAAGLKILRTSYFSWHMGIIGMLQTLMHFFGYNGFIIADIKKIKSTPLLLIPIGILLPFAIIIEALAAMCNRGGVIRCYGIRNTSQNGIAES